MGVISGKSGLSVVVLFDLSVELFFFDDVLAIPLVIGLLIDGLCLQLKASEALACHGMPATDVADTFCIYVVHHDGKWVLPDIEDDRRVIVVDGLLEQIGGFFEGCPILSHAIQVYLILILLFADEYCLQVCLKQVVDFFEHEVYGIGGSGHISSFFFLLQHLQIAVGELGQHHGRDILQQYYHSFLSASVHLQEGSLHAIEHASYDSHGCTLLESYLVRCQV